MTNRPNGGVKMEKEIIVTCHQCQQEYQRIASDKARLIVGFCKSCSIKNVKGFIARSTKPKGREVK